MNSPLLRWLVLGFACLWFGMLVPVHQRGAIKLPGAKPPATDRIAAAPAHCARAADAGSACHKQQAPVGDEAPAPADCAVCHYVLGLHVPPPVTLDVAPLGLLRERVAEDRAKTPLRHAALPFHGLDPPLA